MKNLVFTSLVIFFTFIPFSKAKATALDVNFSFDSFLVKMDTGITGAGGLNLSAEFMFSNNSFKRRVFFGSYGFYGVDTDNLEYRIGAGVKAYTYIYRHLVQGAKYSFGSNIALGGFFYHIIPKANRFSIGAEFWYSPALLSFNGTDRLYDLSARLAFRLIKNLDLYLGYRHIAMHHKNHACEFILDTSPFLGIRFNF